MRRFRDLSIRQKLATASLLTSSMALLSASIAFSVYDRHAFRETLVERLSTDAQIIGFNCISPLLFNDQRAAETTLQALKAEGTVVAAGVYSKDGRLFARYTGPAAEPVEVPEAAGTGVRFEGRYLLVSHPITFESNRIGTVFLKSDLREMDARLGRYGGIVAVVMAGSLLVALALSMRLQRAISTPILGLVGAARAVSTHKDYSVRALPAGQDEVGLLIQTFNEMLGQIEAQDAQLREAHLSLERRVDERTRELAAANKELEAYSYSVSHDLRAPLRSIDGFGRLLLEDYKGRLDAQGVHYLERVRAATQRMSQLIDDMLLLARVSRAELIRQPVNLSDVSARVMAEMARRDSSRNVHVSIVPDLVTRADPHLVDILLENLLGNAWKFTGRRRDAEIEVGQLDQNGMPAYYVRDNGAGFDMAYADKLFGAFQRLHDVSEFEGTGIGLATVHRIVSRHKGRVWAEGAVNRGATFYFTLGEETS